MAALIPMSDHPNNTDPTSVLVGDFDHSGCPASLRWASVSLFRCRDGYVVASAKGDGLCLPGLFASQSEALAAVRDVFAPGAP